MPQVWSNNHIRQLSRLVALGISVLLVAGLSQPAGAAPGDLDTSFSGDGMLTTRMGFNGIGYSAGALSVAIQNDGKTILAGQTGGGNKERFALARYNVNGNRDLNFGTNPNGKVITPFGSFAGARSVAIDPLGGEIVAVGWKVSGNNTIFALARYDSAGVLDTGFDGDGKVTTPIGSNSGATSVAIQPNDQKIVVAGEALIGNKIHFVVARYHTNGSLDSSFGTGGISTTAIGPNAQARSVAFDASGNIVVAGSTSGANASRFAVARYDSSGALDPSFNAGGQTPGVVRTPFGSPSLAGANSVAVDPNGNVVAAGYSGSGSANRFAVARYDSTGILDGSFNPNGTGKVITSMGPYAEGHGVAIDANGKIVVAGSAVQSNLGVFAVARYDSSGILDTTFGNNNGKVKTLIKSSSGGSSLAIDPSTGTLTVAGQASVGNHYRFAVARYDG